MKIAIDARIISTSTGRYVERLLNYLHEIDDENEYLVLVPSKDLGYWRPKKKNFTLIAADYKSYSFGEQIGLAALLYGLKPDLVHFCMPQQPLLYFGKRITTVHDLTLVKFENIDINPILYRIRKTLFALMLRNVIWRSKAVITPTDYVRKDVLDFAGKWHSHKVFKTLEAWDAVADKPEKVNELMGKKFIFFVGNAFPYKNINTIVDAFAKLKDRHPELYLGLAGKKDYFYDEVERYAQQKGVSDRTYFLGFISEGQKRWMFQNAVAYTVASYSEGFHIPGLEAMSEDCPVISSNATCLPEVYENAARYFNPDSPDDLAQAVEEVLTNKKERNKLIEAGREQLKKFSWKRMAEQTLSLYKNVLGN